MSRLYVLRVDEADLDLILEALDSHAYWQLSADEFRNDGAVLEPGTEDEDDAAELAAVRVLEAKLEAVRGLCPHANDPALCTDEACQLAGPRS